MYSRVIDHLSRELLLDRPVRGALDEASIPSGLPACRALLCQGLSPVARPVVVHSTSERLNAADF